MTVESCPRMERIGRRLYEYTGKSGKSYYADREVDGRQERVKLSASNRSEARVAQAALVSNPEEHPKRSQATVQDVGADWLRALNVKPRTHESYDYHLRKNIYPKLETRKIQSVRPQDVAELVAWLRDTRKVSAETAGALRTLSGLCAHAVWERLIPANPVAVVPKTKRPRGQRKEHRYLSSDEIARLLEWTTEAYLPSSIRRSGQGCGRTSFSGSPGAMSTSRTPRSTSGRCFRVRRGTSLLSASESRPTRLERSTLTPSSSRS